LASLTWGGGITALFCGSCVTYYCTLLLASLHGWNGTKYYRYRDLANSIYGAAERPVHPPVQVSVRPMTACLHFCPCACLSLRPCVCPSV
jgi:hypothetical protein